MNREEKYKKISELLKDICVEYNNYQKQIDECIEESEKQYLIVEQASIINDATIDIIRD